MAFMFSPCEPCCTECFCLNKPDTLCFSLGSEISCPITNCVLTYNRITQTWDGVAEYILQASQIHSKYYIRHFCYKKEEYLAIAVIGCGSLFPDMMAFWGTWDLKNNLPFTIDPSWISGIMYNTFPTISSLGIIVGKGNLVSCDPYRLEFSQVYNLSYDIRLGCGGEPQPISGRVTQSICNPDQRFLGLDTDVCTMRMRAPWSYISSFGGPVYKNGPCSWHTESDALAFFDNLGERQTVYDLVYSGGIWTYTVFDRFYGILIFTASKDVFCVDNLTTWTFYPDDPLFGPPAEIPNYCTFRYSGGDREIDLTGSGLNTLDNRYFINIYPYGVPLYPFLCGTESLINKCEERQTIPYRLTATLSCSCPVLDGITIPLVWSHGDPSGGTGTCGPRWVGYATKPLAPFYPYTDPSFYTYLLIVNFNSNNRPIGFPIFSDFLFLGCGGFGSRQMIEFDYPSLSIEYSCPPDPLVMTIRARIKLGTLFGPLQHTICLDNLRSVCSIGTTDWIDLVVHVS